MKRPFVFLLALAALAPALALTQQPSGATPLPIDPKVTVKTLPNGLHYYIRLNAKPEKRAELRLVVNVGSILEDDDQLGYAHFIEHMAFNGTAHFPKNELISYLESIGLQLGADLNAYTSFDETVYQLFIPTDTAKLVEKAFQILADWAHEQTFDSTEVVNERGVVLEEWRRGKGAGQRMANKAIPIVLKGSRYADRNPIGNDKSIMAANPSVLKRYYQQWYRADLMAVVAVGDFDENTIEALIKKYFGDLPAVINARERTFATVPPNQAPLVSIATDSEATGSFVSVNFKRPWAPLKTVDDYRRSLIERIYLTSINNRLYEMTQKPRAPFLGAGMSFGSYYARDLDAFTLGANVKENGIVPGLEAVLTEIRRADEFGFLQAELDRAKTNILRGYERSYAERFTQPHGAYVGSYVNAFLYGTTPMAIDYTWPLTQKLVPTITLAELNGLSAKWITDDNRVIVAQTPAKAGVKAPTEQEILAAFTASSKEKLRPYTETVSDAPLIASAPIPGRVVSERTIAEIGVTEWKLSNGARVLVKPTDFKADEVRLSGGSDGGTSLVKDDEYLSASVATAIASISGAGRYSAVELQKKLTGKAVIAIAGIGEYSESMSGFAAPSDLETMFQLLYVRIVEPRIDADAWNAAKDRVLTAIANRKASPEFAWIDTIAVTMAQHDFRSRPLTASMVETIEADRAIAFYKSRFADFSDFTFAIVGNVKLGELKPLVETYLASLPSNGRTETWKDVGKPPPRGVIENTLRRGTEDKASTEFIFTGPFKNTADNRFALSALVSVLRIRLTETLREQLGRTYSPSVGGGGGRIPREEFSISIGYPSSPASLEKLKASVFAVIDTLKTRGPTQADIDKVRENITRSRETAVKTNAYWMGVLSSRTESIDEYLKFTTLSAERLKNLTPAQVQEAAKLYLDIQNYAHFVLLPATAK